LIDLGQADWQGWCIRVGHVPGDLLAIEINAAAFGIEDGDHAMPAVFW